MQSTPPNINAPCAAIRASGSQKTPARWLIGRHPSAQWRAASAFALIDNCLQDARQQLENHHSGLLVGLLPYPNQPGKQLSESNIDTPPTPATLMLFEDHEQASLLSGLPETDFSLQTPFKPDWSRDGYIQAVEKVQRYLTAGDAYQVNLAQRFSAPFSGDPWQAFVAIQEAVQAPHAAWLDLGDRAVLSFSPESFLEVSERQITTRPIKGTRPRSHDPATDAMLANSLLAHPKDQAENLMIVDLLRNDLGQVCEPGSIRVPSLFAIESFRNVHHLVSTVTGTLKPNAGVSEYLRACFPGGSITGAPKRRAMEIIAELEPHPRDIYCGTLFWLKTDGSFGSNILIRSFLASSGQLLGWAGAGIVMDSHPEAEYAECLDKLDSFMCAFNKLRND